MTVKELIEILKVFDGDTSIFVNDNEEEIYEAVYKTKITATHALGEVHTKEEAPKVILHAIAKSLH